MGSIPLVYHRGYNGTLLIHIKGYDMRCMSKQHIAKAKARVKTLEKHIAIIPSAIADNIARGGVMAKEEARTLRNRLGAYEREHKALLPYTYIK